VALKLHTADRLPRGYLQRLLRACATRELGGALRNTTAELLCAFVQQNLRSMPAVKLAVAIDALEEVPCSQARQCLKGLVRAGRFALSSDLRTIRIQAREVLARIEQGARA